MGRDRGLVVTRALQIDRRRHLELQLQRQVQRDLKLVQQSHVPGQASFSEMQLERNASAHLQLHGKHCGSTQLHELPTVKCSSQQLWLQPVAISIQAPAAPCLCFSQHYLSGVHSCV